MEFIFHILKISHSHFVIVFLTIRYFTFAITVIKIFSLQHLLICLALFQFLCCFEIESKKQDKTDRSIESKKLSETEQKAFEQTQKQIDPENMSSGMTH